MKIYLYMRNQLNYYIKYFEFFFMEINGDEFHPKIVQLLDHIGDLHYKLNSYEDGSYYIRSY